MKEHNIKRIVASPGTTNITLLASLQQDPYFEIFSSVDERSAAYIACGMASETQEPVALTCTGATASRNYVSGLTEAYYRKLPILAITSSQHLGRVGHNMPQVIDRSSQMKDICKLSVEVEPIHSEEDEWSVNVKINNALLELTHNGGGPVHINLVTTYSKNYSVKKLPCTRVIRRIGYGGDLPKIPEGRIGIFVGAHLEWSEKLTAAVDEFCEKYNSVVFCDLTSNYKGKYRVFPSLVCSQTSYMASCRRMEVMIHIGEITGSDINMQMEEVWRVSLDGKVKDTYRKLRYVFEMDEQYFFEQYNKICDKSETITDFFKEWKNECIYVAEKIPELPFSNVWLAGQTLNKLPEKSSIYFGILNSLRSWNYYEAPPYITGYSNTGGFGIDGGMSSLIGASFTNRSKLFFCVTGDLAFFYDMNVVGNRHVSNNLRILLVNNGRGTEFTNYNHPGAQFKENALPYIAADGHYGNKSKVLVRHYAEDLGYIYMHASSKNEYVEKLNVFLSPKMLDKPILFEVFTDPQDESDAVEIMHSLIVSTSATTKQIVKGLIGEKRVSTLKKILNH